VEPSQTFASRVHVEITHDVADVRLVRASKRNALDGAMFSAIADAIDFVGSSTARAVVLSGEGNDFCAGLDLGMFAEIQAGTPPSGIPKNLVRRTHGQCNLPQFCVMGWQALSVPVIAAIHGSAIGGGLQLSLGADIRIVHPDARLMLKEVHWGLVPDMGAFTLLPRLLRSDQLRRLILASAQVSGREAVEIGLATQLHETPWQAAHAMAGLMAKSDSSAVAAAKRLCNDADIGTMAMLEKEAVAQQHQIHTLLATASSTLDGHVS
jgi:enoyl-CoA hydratase/carnithine racemase